MRAVALTSAVAAVAIAVAGSAAGANQRDALVRPGISIGKVRLGMTFAQVRSGLGRPMFVNRRVRLDFGRVYVEYAWAYSEWLVGFQSEGGVLRVVRISTTSRKERTRDGIGVGTRVRAIVRRYPNAQCRTHSATIGGTWILIRHQRGRLTTFKIAPLSDKPPYPQGAVEVVVKEPVREFGVGRIGTCPPDWRTW
jgi:hypothetical protein